MAEAKITIRDYTPEEAQWFHDAQAIAAARPFEAKVIPRRAPPTCGYCGAIIGKCQHTGA